MGLLWADGHVDKGKVTLKISWDDFIDIKENIETLLERPIKVKKRRRENWKDQSDLSICSMEFVKFLKVFEYDSKSKNGSPEKFFSFISSDLLPYWWMGYIDGDGYVGKDKITITSNYNQKWDFCECLSEQKVFYKIYRNTNKTIYSTITIGNKSSIIRLWNYIY